MLTLFFGAFAVMCPAWGERPLPPRPSTYKVSAAVAYFQSTANYDSGGTSRSLFDGDGEFDTITGQLELTYDWTRMWRTYVSLSYANAASTAPSAADGGTVALNNSGFNEFAAGGQAWYRLPFVSLVPEVSVRYPFWRVNEASNAPLIGEGSLRAQVGGWAIARLGIYQPFVYAGYQYSDVGRAALMPYSAGLNVRVLGPWWIEGAWRGSLSVSNDSDSTNQIPRDQFLARVDAGSFHYYAINPNLGEVALESGAHFGRAGQFGAFAGYSMSVLGSNAANGWSIYGGVSFSSDLVLLSPPAPREKPEGHFKLPNDKYDESLFIENGEPEEQKSNVRRKVRQKPSVEKLMHQTEKGLNREDREDESDSDDGQ